MKRIFIFIIISLICCVLFVGCSGMPQPTQTPQMEETPEESDYEGAELPEYIRPVKTTAKAPAAVGDWTYTKIFSESSGEQETAFFRITDIVRGEAAKSQVDKHNAGNSLLKIGELQYSDLEYALISYEVYLPEDFPHSEDGVSPILSFSITTAKGDAIGDYSGLPTVTDISTQSGENKILAGETFEDGRALFAMVQGFTDYVVENSYENEAGEKLNSFVDGI